jgi:hypothetical protein
VADKCANCGGPLYAEPKVSPVTVTFDITDPEDRHALTQALDDYQAKQSDLAARGDRTATRTGWAVTARRYRDQADKAAAR